MKLWLIYGVIGVSVLLSGCHTTSSIQSPAQNFVTASTALLQAESDYMDEIQQASDASYQLDAAERYVSHADEWKQIASTLKHHDNFSKAKALRVKVLEELVNYAQVLDTLSKDGDTSWLKQNTKDTTDTIAGILKDSNAAHVTDEQKGVIESVITTFGNSIIDNAAADKIQHLAEHAKQPIAGIRKMVEEDDSAIEKNLFSPGLEKDQESSRKNILHSIYEDKDVNTAQRLDAFLSVQNIRIATVTKRQNIIDALKKLEAANNALAAKNNIAASALAEQAITYAQLGATVYKETQSK